MQAAGASTTVDGITSRPVYVYQPPSSFFTGGSHSAGAVIDARDFGAVADPAVDNRGAIQAAIDAAHAAGGGTVHLPSGIYGVAGHPSGNGALYLQSNVFLVGDGMGETVLRVVDGSAEKITGIIRTPAGEPTTNYGIADLTLDGNRANTTGKVDAFYTGGTPSETIADEDAWVLRVEAANASGYGFDPHEQTHRLVIQDSVAHHNGLDGFVADYLVDSVFEGNLAYENDRHGFNIVTSTNDFLVKDNVAHDNGDSGIVVQRGSEDILSPSNVLITGGEVFSNGRDGVRISMSDNVTIEGLEITENGTYGVRLIGSGNITVRDNVIVDNSRSNDGDFAAIQARENDDSAVTGDVYPAENNLITGNVISWSDGMSGSYGVEERPGQAGHNEISGNSIAGDVINLYRIASPDTEITHKGSASGDSIVGGPGNDWISGNSGADILHGGAGNDWLSGDRSGDELFGEEGDDTLYGRDGDDAIDGGEGADWISGGKGADLVHGGGDDDQIFGNSGADRLFGDGGNDTISGNDGDDLIEGGDGDDILLGGKGIDRIVAGDGDDQIAGNSNTDILEGGAGNDVLDGNSGNDYLDGGEGADILRGGSGTDHLIGGWGDDILSGGGGYDNFDFRPGDGHDTIIDFKPGQDDLDFSAFGLESFEDVISHISENSTSGIRIDLDAETSVTLEGLTIGALSESDFVF